MPKRKASTRMGGKKRKGFLGSPVFKTLSSRRHSKELKFFDIFGLSTVLPVFGAINSTVPSTSFATLFNPTLGVGQSTREGRKCTLKSVQIQFKYTPGLVTSIVTQSPASYLRAIVLLDRNSNAALPTVTDILTSSTSFAYFNPVNADRFKILADKRYNMNYNPNAAGVLSSVQTQDDDGRIYIFRKLNDEVIFNNTTQTIATTNNILVLFIGDFTAGVGNIDTTVSWTSRVRFYDD